MDRFAFYHQNEALLFQFILHECLCTYQKLLGKPNEDLITELTGGEPSKWQTRSGHFQKIQHYYSLFTTHFPDRMGDACEKSIQALEQHLNQANIPEFKKEIKKFTTISLEQLPAFKDDEHVLFFLLQHQKPFDKMYGKAFTTKTLASLFPEGLEGARAFLEERYSKKGFNHILPIIQQQTTVIL